MRILGIMNILRLKLNILINNPFQIPVISATGLVAQWYLVGKEGPDSQREPIYYKRTFIYLKLLLL